MRRRLIPIDAVSWKFENAKCGSEGIVALGLIRHFSELGFFGLAWPDFSTGRASHWAVA